MQLIMRHLVQLIIVTSHISSLEAQIQSDADLYANTDEERTQKRLEEHERDDRWEEQRAAMRDIIQAEIAAWNTESSELFRKWQDQSQDLLSRLARLNHQHTANCRDGQAHTTHCEALVEQMQEEFQAGTLDVQLLQETIRKAFAKTADFEKTTTAQVAKLNELGQESVRINQESQQEMTALHQKHRAISDATTNRRDALYAEDRRAYDAYRTAVDLLYGTMDDCRERMTRAEQKLVECEDRRE